MRPSFHLNSSQSGFGLAGKLKEDKAMREVQGDHKHAKPKAMLSKSTFLLFDSLLPRRYYNILSALDCLPLLGCNHQLSQKQSHFKTCMSYSCPHAICTWMSTHASTCCAPNVYARDTGTPGRRAEAEMHAQPHVPMYTGTSPGRGRTALGTACSSRSSPCTEQSGIFNYLH